MLIKDRSNIHSIPLVTIKTKTMSTLISPYAVISELISTVYNLTALSKSWQNKNSAVDLNSELSLATTLKKWLTIIEYSETLLELATLSLPLGRGAESQKSRQDLLKWTIVSLLQLSKCAGRMTLLLKYGKGLLPHPPLQVKKENLILLNTITSNPTGSNHSYILRSGRRVRSVRQTSSSCSEVTDSSDTAKAESVFSPELIMAEAAYIMKPIAHLVALYLSGTKSWKPWILSLLMDVGSLLVMFRAMSKGQLTDKQMQIVLQRRTSLILYLLRSPFYDRNTKMVFQVVLYTLEMYIPCTSSVLVQPLLSHLPLIKKIYFYVWSH